MITFNKSRRKPTKNKGPFSNVDSMITAELMYNSNTFLSQKAVRIDFSNHMSFLHTFISLLD